MRGLSVPSSLSLCKYTPIFNKKQIISQKSFSLNSFPLFAAERKTAPLG